MLTIQGLQKCFFNKTNYNDCGMDIRLGDLSTNTILYNLGNSIITRVVNINDVEFASTQTAEAGNTIDCSVLYDATTGERVG